MNSETPLDFAHFQLSPRRSRCELFISGNGKTERLASGLFKPFLSHLKAAEERATQSAHSIKLEIEKKGGHSGSWFHKGTLERFVRFVSTPEVLEIISTLDGEMSQLEGAKRIYGIGGGDPLSGTLSGESERAETMPGDSTKKELLRAIDVRMAAVKQELTAACARASSAGFSLESISDLRLFADYFGAHRLNLACSKFLSLCQRRPEMITRPVEQQQPLLPPPLQPVTQKAPPPLRTADGDVRASSGSDMSVDDLEDATTPTVFPSATRPLTGQGLSHQKNSAGSNYSDQQQWQQQQPRPFRARSADPPANQEQKLPSTLKMEDEPPPAQPAEGSRRLSVQDRISMFESKQKEQSGSRGGSKGELWRQSSDLTSAVLRRWSGASDMSIDHSGSNANSNVLKETEIVSSVIPSSSLASHNDEKDTADSQPRSNFNNKNNQKDDAEPKDKVASSSMISSAENLKEKAESLRFMEDDSESVGQLSSGMNKELKTQSSSSSSSSSSYVQKKPAMGPLAANKMAAVRSQPKQKIPSDKAKPGQPEPASSRREPIARVNKIVDCQSNDELTGESTTGARFSKGNQGLNEELQMKADELEKIFAAHKLRLQADQTSAVRRGKPVDIPVDDGRPAEKKSNCFDLGSLEDLRGKFYERYVQKREEKLREEWDMKRDEKEAKMKKMFDDLERSRAEMARLSGSSLRMDLRVNAFRPAENSAQSKDGARSHLRSSTRSKSIGGDITLVDEEKNSCRSQSTRKTLPVTGSGFIMRSLKSLDQDDPKAPRSTRTSALLRNDGDDDDYDDDDDAAAVAAADDDDDDDSVAMINASVSSVGESPGSWNDASMDSSGGSPTRADSSRMRKKWGNAQKPIVASDSSNLQRRDASKGFKRLLTFGRKNKGGAGGQIVDFVSASTASEAEEDAEDGRTLLTDLRNSRTGASHFHYVHDGFSDSDQFYEQGARSFFSLSLRAKGPRTRPV